MAFDSSYWDNFSPQGMAQKAKENIHSPTDINERRDYALSYSWANAAKEHLALCRSLLTWRIDKRSVYALSKPQNLFLIAMVLTRGCKSF